MDSLGPPHGLHQGGQVGKLDAGYQSLSGAQIGTYGSILTNLKVYQPTLSPALVSGATTAEQTLSVPGLLADDIVLTVNKPTAQAGLGIVGWRVSAADTLAIVFVNDTVAGITPTAGEVYTVVVINVYSS